MGFEGMVFKQISQLTIIFGPMFSRKLTRGRGPYDVVYLPPENVLGSIFKLESLDSLPYRYVHQIRYPPTLPTRSRGGWTGTHPPGRFMLVKYFIGSY